MNREHNTIERGHPACQGEEFSELPLLLSSRHLAALKGGYPDDPALTLISCGCLMFK